MSEAPDAVLCCRAPRDHGNTDGVDPDSCDDVHVSDVLVSLNALATA